MDIIILSDISRGSSLNRDQCFVKNLIKFPLCEQFLSGKYIILIL